MFVNLKNHFKIILFSFFFILIACQIQEPAKNHGIIFLENRAGKLNIDVSNQNDVINVMGQPHSKSVNDEFIWMYLERTLSKGKYHKLGRHVLKTNNTLVLTFDKYGVLKSKKFYNIDDLNSVKFSDKKTENKLSKKSFVETFLSSIKSKMYGNK